jgi:hypothetical protein
MGKAKTTTVAGRADSEGKLTTTAMVVLGRCGVYQKKRSGDDVVMLGGRGERR